MNRLASDSIEVDQIATHRISGNCGAISRMAIITVHKFYRL